MFVIILIWCFTKITSFLSLTAIKGFVLFGFGLFTLLGFVFFFLPSLRKKCPNTEFFSSVFSSIWTEYGKIRTRKTPYFDAFHAVHIWKSRHNYFWYIQSFLWNSFSIYCNRNTNDTIWIFNRFLGLITSTEGILIIIYITVDIS